MGRCSRRRALQVFSRRLDPTGSFRVALKGCAGVSGAREPPAVRKRSGAASSPEMKSGRDSGICVGYGRGKVLGKLSGVEARLLRGSGGAGVELWLWAALEGEGGGGVACEGAGEVAGTR